MPELFASDATVQPVAAPAAQPTSKAGSRPLEAPGPARSNGRGRGALTVAALALVGLLAGAGMGTARPVIFESSTHASVSIADASPVLLDDDPGFVREAAQSYASVAVQPIVLERAASRLGSEGRDLRGSVSARVEPDSAVLVIAARGVTPSVATHRAEAVVDALVDVVPALTPDGASDRLRLTRLDVPRASVDPGWIGGIAGGGATRLGGGLLVGLLLLVVRRPPLGPPSASPRVAVP